MNKRALITGINGQDGSYLCELLLSKGYEVTGILKRNSVAENQTARIPDEVFSNIKLFYLVSCFFYDNHIRISIYRYKFCCVF